jgi:Mg2+ and Co2+ transporter CorA
MARWIVIQLLGGAAWAATYMIGRAIFGIWGMGVDLSVGDEAAVMFPAICAVVFAQAVWDRA